MCSDEKTRTALASTSTGAGNLTAHNKQLSLISDVADVTLTGPVCGEVPLHPISKDLGTRILDRGDMRFAQVNADDVVRTHQPSDPFMVDRPVHGGIGGQLDSDPPVPIRAIPIVMDVSDPHNQSIISCLTISSILT